MYNTSGINYVLKVLHEPKYGDQFALINDCKTVIGVRGMHGRMYPNYCLVTTLLLVYDHLSSSTIALLVICLQKESKTTLVSRQQPTINVIITVTTMYNIIIEDVKLRE